jgi:hypothetical protein
MAPLDGSIVEGALATQADLELGDAGKDYDVDAPSRAQARAFSSSRSVPTGEGVLSGVAAETSVAEGRHPHAGTP